MASSFSISFFLPTTLGKSFIAANFEVEIAVLAAKNYFISQNMVFVVGFGCKKNTNPLLWVHGSPLAQVFP
jgi:hypothetical protein